MKKQTKPRTKAKKSILDEPTRSPYFPGQKMREVVEYLANEHDPSATKTGAARDLVRNRGVKGELEKRIVEIKAEQARDQAKTVETINEQIAPSVPGRGFDGHDIKTCECDFCNEIKQGKRKPEPEIVDLEKIHTIKKGDLTIDTSRFFKGKTLFEVIDFTANYYVDYILPGLSYDVEAHEKYVEGGKLVGVYQVIDNYAERVRELRGLEPLVCVCGHTDEQHFGEPGGDYSAKIPCEAGTSSGDRCPCNDFTHEADPSLFEPDVSPELARMLDALTFEGKKFADMSPQQRARADREINNPKNYCLNCHKWIKGELTCNTEKGSFCSIECESKFQDPTKSQPQAFMNFSGDPASPSEHESDPTPADVEAIVETEHRNEIEMRAYSMLEANYTFDPGDGLGFQAEPGELVEKITDFAIAEIGRFFGIEPESKNLEQSSLKTGQAGAGSVPGVKVSFDPNAEGREKIRQVAFEFLNRQKIANRPVGLELLLTNFFIEHVDEFRPKYINPQSEPVSRPIEAEFMVAGKVLEVFRKKQKNSISNLKLLEKQMIEGSFGDLDVMQSRLDLARDVVEHYTRAGELIEEVLRGDQ